MMSHRLLTTSVNMSTLVNSPLKIGLKVEHEGTYYKIISFYRQQNSVNQYIIQYLSTGKTKRVFRHQICDAEILRSDWLRSTGNFVVNHLTLFICNKIYIEPCQYISIRYFKPQFQPQFRFPYLNSQFYHF